MMHAFPYTRPDSGQGVHVDRKRAWWLLSMIDPLQIKRTDGCQGESGHG